MSSLTLPLVDLAATEMLGAAIAATLLPGDRVLLSGDLGAGKTTLARAIGTSLGAVPPLASPTFVLVSEHAGRLPIWHGDAYRLDPGSDPRLAGFVDERQAGGVTILEWPERVLLPPDPRDLQIRLEMRAGDERRAHIDAADLPRLEQIANGFRGGQ